MCCYSEAIGKAQGMFLVVAGIGVLLGVSGERVGEMMERNWTDPCQSLSHNTYHCSNRESW
jgi:hypothetical protein